MKRTPTLEFLYDDTTDRAMRVEELLDRTSGEGLAAGGEGEDA
jgi:ribosome-binding factor A